MPKSCIRLGYIALLLAVGITSASAQCSRLTDRVCGFIYSGGRLVKGINYPPADQSMPAAITTDQRVVGTFDAYTHEVNGFLYTNGIYTKIADPDSPDNSTRAYGINDGGQIVGAYATYVDQQYTELGFLYINGTYTTILFPGSYLTEVRGINNTGTMAGNYDLQYGDGTYHGFIYSNGTFTTIDYPGARDTILTGINDNGDVVGYAQQDSGTSSGFLYSNGQFTQIAYPGAVDTYVGGVNNSDQVVGTAAMVGGFRAFIWQQGQFTDFQIPGWTTWLEGINNNGDIAGYITH